MISASILLPLIAIGLIVGVLVGAVSIGGVLLVPALLYIGGIPVHTAIPACLFSYILTGLVGTLMYARKGSIQWRMAGWICAGVIPGAYIGAATATYIPENILEWIVVILVVFAGLDALRKRTDHAGNIHSRTGLLILIGFVTGIGSAISGTGGPLIMTPLLLWLKVPVLITVGLGQFVQIPVSVFSTTSNLVHGNVDFSLGIAIAIVTALGVIVGARIAHAMPASSLRRVIAVVLILTGLLMSARLGYQGLASVI